MCVPFVYRVSFSVETPPFRAVGSDFIWGGVSPSKSGRYIGRCFCAVQLYRLAAGFDNQTVGQFAADGYSFLFCHLGSPIKKQPERFQAAYMQVTISFRADRAE